MRRKRLDELSPIESAQIGLESMQNKLMMHHGRVLDIDACIDDVDHLLGTDETIGIEKKKPQKVVLDGAKRESVMAVVAAIGLSINGIQDGQMRRNAKGLIDRISTPEREISGSDLVELRMLLQEMKHIESQDDEADFLLGNQALITFDSKKDEQLRQQHGANSMRLFKEILGQNQDEIQTDNALHFFDEIMHLYKDSEDALQTIRHFGDADPKASKPFFQRMREALTEHMYESNFAESAEKYFYDQLLHPLFGIDEDRQNIPLFLSNISEKTFQQKIDSVNDTKNNTIDMQQGIFHFGHPFHPENIYLFYAKINPKNKAKVWPAALNFIPQKEFLYVEIHLERQLIQGFLRDNTNGTMLFYTPIAEDEAQKKWRIQMQDFELLWHKILKENDIIELSIARISENVMT